MLVLSSCEGKVRERGGLRRDLRVTVIVLGPVVGLEKAERGRMGSEVRGRVYWVDYQ